MSQSLAITLPLYPERGLSAYLRAVNSLPVLSADEERKLAYRLHQHNDLDAARQLVMANLRNVVRIARGFSGYGLPQADLIQEGNIGLMKAVKHYDPAHKVRLMSFAVHWIKAEIYDYILRNWRIVKVATTKAQRKLFFNLRSLKQSPNALGVEDAKAMAQQLGVKAEEVLEMEMRLNGQDIALEPLGTDEEGGFAPIAYLAAEDAEPGQLLEHAETARRRGAGLAKALENLDARSRRIIEARAHWIRLGYRPPDWPRHDAAPHAMTALNRPRRVIEVGSGNSTKFIRRAIRDHGLPTAIVSIDPQPRGRRSDPLT